MAALLLVLGVALSAPALSRAQALDRYSVQASNPVASRSPLAAQGQIVPIGGTPTPAWLVPTPTPAPPTATATPHRYLPTDLSFETSTPTNTPTPGPTRTATQTPTVTPTRATPTPVAWTEDPLAAVEPEPPCEPTVTFEVTTERDRYWITEQAAMPPDLVVTPSLAVTCDVTVEDLVVVWDLEIEYLPRDLDPDFALAYRMHHRWPGQASYGLDPFVPDFGASVRGGTLTISATTWVDHVPHTAKTTVTILGTNPSPGTLQTYFAASFPISYYTLWRIAQAESNLRHFTDDGHPKWSNDGHRGVGLMQITYPAPTDDEVWSWKLNADAGSRVLQAAYATARGWPSTVSASREVSVAIAAYNTARERDEKPPVARVTVPDLTSGNFACNPLQRERNAIRLYNGAGGTDPLGLPLHEYRLALDPTTRLLDLDVDEETLTATAKWVQVDPDERPRGVGVPNYVGLVLSRPTPGACR